jgi:hypothetical protein
MELLLGIGQFMAALVVAAFTWKLAQYTQELVKAQEASNRVVERQAELMKRQTVLQEAQHRLQERLAESEGRPLLALQAELSCNKRGGATRRGNNPTYLALTNLGRYGVLVTKLKQYQQKPSAPDAKGFAGTPAGQGKQRFPLPLPPGKSECLRDSQFHPHHGSWVEVVYEDGASGRRRSDLWQYTGARLGFVREWWAREVLEKEAGQG